MLPSGMPSWMAYKSSPSSRILLLWALIVLFGIVSYLPSRQMSFVLRAGSGNLPTPLNLAWWKIQSNPRCPICGSQNKPNYPPYLERLCFCSQPGKIYLETWFCAPMYCVLANPYPGGGQVYVCWLAWLLSFWLPSHRRSINFLPPWPISLCWLHYQNSWTNCVQQHHGRVLKLSIKETV